ncbi:MAG: lasso peptide biosynthesis B2 protein [Prochloron sp. SP5CPC1]|nr:lasso peptide biosynthesis B2 protein [Candidatus Paraprochloron terpiosi SP5CPC1]
MDWLKLGIRKYRSFWGLGRLSRWLLLQALLLLPLVALSLKWGRVKWTQAGLARLLPAAKMPLPNGGPRSSADPVGTPDRISKVVKTTRMVQLAVKYCQPWAKCLQKSLVLWGLLRHQGIDSELRIGVRREATNFEAHAWVECEGFVLNDAGDVRDRFAMFYRPIEVNLPS